MWKAAWKSLLGHKLRLVLSTLSVVLGIAFLSGAMTFTGMLSRTFDALTQGTIPDISVAVSGSSNDDESSVVSVEESQPSLTDEDIDRIREVDGVESASGWITSYNTIYLLTTDNKVIATNGAPSVASNYINEPAMNHQTGLNVIDGRSPTADDEIAIDPISLENSGYQIGDQVRVLTTGDTETMTLVGTATWGSGGTAGASYLFFNDATAQQLMMNGIDGYQSASVTAERGTDIDDLAQRIDEVIPDQFSATTGEEQASEIQSYISQMMSFINIFLGVFAAIALIVAGFLIVNTFSILVTQRSRELALYRALGASRKQVRRSVVFEAVVTGLIGGVLGVLLGALLAFGIGRAVAAMGMDMGSEVPLPSVGVVILSLALAVVVTVAAAWVPASRASRVPPVAAMNGDFGSGNQGLGRRSVVGALMVIVGLAGLVVGSVMDFNRHVWVLGAGAFLVLIGVALVSPIAGRPLIWLLGKFYRLVFGETGKLAELNAVRQPRRTAATSSALMIGLALVTTLSVLGSSARVSVHDGIRDNVRGNLVVTSVSNSALPTGLRDEVSDIAGVQTVRSMRTVLTQTDDAMLYLVGYQASDFDHIVAQTMVEGSMSDDINTVIISQERADDTGETVGDTIELMNPATMQQVTVTITGIFSTAEGVNFGDVNTNFDTLAEMGNTDRDSRLTVDIDSGASEQDVKEQLQELTADNPLLTVQDQEEYANTQTAQIDQMLTMIYALLGLAIVIAVLGIVNTLALSVIERTREIGLMRAVGMKRRQIRTMITLESVTIALLGAVLGVAMGAVFGVALQRTLVDQGLTILSIPWSQLIAFLVVSVIVGVLAAIVPARSAARQNMLEAIASE